MYEEVKLDTEANTPDRYAGVGNPRTMANVRPDRAVEFPRVPMITTKDLEAGFGNKAHDFESSLRGKAQDTSKSWEAGISEKLHNTESDLSGKASEIQSGFSHKVKELELFGSRLKDLASEIGQKARDAAQDVEAHGKGIVREAESMEEHAKRMANQSHVAVRVDSSLSGAEKKEA